ncbi:hypothetical protein ACFWU5_06185 [Nocardia sp. NPDC058640]|uniref:DUF7373 family lipoprotein n=1 Tax=Nocardia sp. NPDC058640 TaxID=3346571 RepID=UPI00364B5BEE
MLKIRLQPPRSAHSERRWNLPSRDHARGIAATAIAIGLLFTAACGGESATPPPTTPAEPQIDLSKLELGNYAGVPQPLDKPVDEAQARAVQAQRLANHIPLPMEIDPRLKYYSGVIPKVFTTIDHQNMGSWVGSDLEPHREALAGFVSGFTSAANSDERLSLSVVLENRVLIFNSDIAATTAMNTIVDSELAADPTKSSFPIANFPTARAYWKPDRPTFWSWYATGKFVIFTSVWDRLSGELSQVDLPGMTDLVSKSLTAIPGKIAGFSPTPAPERDSSSPDWDGMLARAVPAINDQRPGLTIPGVYDRHGGLQLSRQPELDRTLFETAGVDRVAFNGGYLYRAKDAASAIAVTNQHTTFTKYYRKVASPPGLPTARCYELKDPTTKSKMRYYCSTNFDRYAADISANQLDDAYQRISAQYALLVNSK